MNVDVQLGRPCPIERSSSFSDEQGSKNLEKNSKKIRPQSLDFTNLSHYYGRRFSSINNNSNSSSNSSSSTNSPTPDLQAGVQYFYLGNQDEAMQRFAQVRFISLTPKGTSSSEFIERRDSLESYINGDTSNSPRIIEEKLVVITEQAQNIIQTRALKKTEK